MSQFLNSSFKFIEESAYLMFHRDSGQEIGFAVFTGCHREEFPNVDEIKLVKYSQYGKHEEKFDGNGNFEKNSVGQSIDFSSIPLANNNPRKNKAVENLSLSPTSDPCTDVASQMIGVPMTEHGTQ